MLRTGSHSGTWCTMGAADVLKRELFEAACRYLYLDLTALGGQEDRERPAGRSDGPAGAWMRCHDRY
ncbi:MAG: hypothetical protein QOI21_5889 [Actinomycetota bacterium]|nr:hypothetical protein [Actinomycetota bacterium]